MKSNSPARTRALLLAASALAALSGAAHAADADAHGAPPAVQEVVVTALKQNTTAMQTPATVAVLSADALASRSVTNTSQLSGVVPGLVMSVGVAGLPGVSFRGLGSNSAVFSLEPSVGQYQDGVYLGHSRSYVSPLYDVDHVEFIQGTQSTLLGKNVSLGAISIVNHRPTSQFGWDVTAQHDFGVDGDKFEGALNAPVSDKLAVRAALLASRDDGFIHNTFLDRQEARQDDISGRLMILARPSDSTDLLVSYQHDRRDLQGQDLQVLTDPSGAVRGWSAAYGITQTIAPYRTAAAQRAFGHLGDVDPYDVQNTDRLNFVGNIDLDVVKVTLQTAYVAWNSSRATDLDFTPINLIGLDDAERDREFTQELRLSSSAIPRTHLVGGVFYYHDRWTYDRTVEASPNSAGFPLSGTTNGVTRLTTRSISVFGSGVFDIAETLKFDAGLRYTNERKTGDFVRAGTGVVSAVFPDTPFTTYAPQETNPLDYNVGLRFLPSARLLFYVTYAKASKSGGFQDFPTTAAGAPFLPETAYSTEVGAKVKLDRGYVTGAFFDTRIHNFQTSYTLAVGTPPVSQTVVGNSQVRSTGFQLNGGYELAPRLKVDGQLVYADSRFTQDFSTLTKSGDALTRAPKWTGEVSVSYDHPVREGLTGFGKASVDFSSKTLFQFVRAQPLAPFGEAHAELNAQLGVRNEADSWELSVVGTNLTGAEYIVFATSVSAGGGAYYGAYNRPRTVALQLKLKH